MMSSQTSMFNAAFATGPVVCDDIIQRPPPTSPVVVGSCPPSSAAGPRPVGLRGVETPSKVEEVGTVPGRPYHMPVPFRCSSS